MCAKFFLQIHLLGEIIVELLIYAYVDMQKFQHSGLCNRAGVRTRVPILVDLDSDSDVIDSDLDSDSDVGTRRLGAESLSEFSKIKVIAKESNFI